jgi:signal transduction histidine kinase
MTASAAFTPNDGRFDQLRKLWEIGRSFTYTTSLDEVARLTVERGAGLFDAAAAVLMLADSNGLLQVRAAHGIAEDLVTRFRAPLSDATIARLQGLLAMGDDSFIAVPLVVGGAVTGLVAVALTRPFTEGDEWLLSALADQAAVALENARLGGEVRIEMEGRLRESEGSTHAKDQALATLAHDIRTPLAAISGYCEILEEELLGPINKKQRDALGKVRMSGRHLLSLLVSVMDMARLTAGVVKVDPEPVRLTDMAREAVHILTPVATAKRQTLKLDNPATVIVMGNDAKVRQVLVNLIGNAVKFTPEHGSITVTTQMRTISASNWGEVRVTDTGPGIPEAERKAIFEPYYRSSGTATTPGVGLGLAISHALIALMGGELHVESEVGVGTTFSILLPADNPR